MNREDIIRMAREAGSIDSEDVIETVYAAFAAAEREACAKLADERLMDTSALLSMPPKSSAAWSIAAAIRAMGQQ